MAIQTLNCKRGRHTWRRESQRGKPPLNCPNDMCAEADAVVIEPISNDDTESYGPVISGKDLARRLMHKLESRGQALHQQNGRAYSGPRY